MKKKHLSLAVLCMGIIFTACNNSSQTSTTTDTTTTTTTTPTTTTMDTAHTAPATTTAPANLSEADKKFLNEAAVGGMMEVQLGQAAQQQAANGRVKAFGQMMVTDHSQANDQLKTLASQKGVTLPAEMPADKKKHTDEMTKMQGKSFDQHYMGMMVSDHKEDINLFEKEAKNGQDNDVKNWANQVLPVLKKHLDSAQAINKMKM